MATRNPLALLVVGALSFAGTQRGDAVTIGRPAADPKTPTPAGASVLRIDTRDHQTPGHLEQLRRSSAMARDLLARVGNLRATVLFLRGDPAFVKKSGVYGQSRFWVQNGELFGSIRYQAGPLNSLETKCLIVHELAHAVEMASSDRTAAGLREFVLSRAIGPDPSPARAETAFPRRVALAVLAQLRSRSAGGNSLAQIAEVIRDHTATPSGGRCDGVGVRSLREAPEGGRAATELWRLGRVVKRLTARLRPSSPSTDRA